MAASYVCLVSVRSAYRLEDMSGALCTRSRAERAYLPASRCESLFSLSSLKGHHNCLCATTTCFHDDSAVCTIQCGTGELAATFLDVSLTRSECAKARLSERYTESSAIQSRVPKNVPTFHKLAAVCQRAPLSCRRDPPCRSGKTCYAALVPSVLLARHLKAGKRSAVAGFALSAHKFRRRASDSARRSLSQLPPVPARGMTGRDLLQFLGL